MLLDMQREASDSHNVAPRKLYGWTDQASSKKDAEMIDLPVNGDNYCIFSDGIPRPFAKLCANCQNIFNHWEQISMAGTGHLPHCDNERALKASADAGCGLCAQFMPDRGGIMPYHPSFYIDNVGNHDDDLDGSGDVEATLSRGFIWLQHGDKLSYVAKRDYWQAKLILPYLMGDNEEYDEWAGEESLCVEHVVLLFPVQRQGWSRMHPNFNSILN